jgi:hypothetical protein
MQFRMHCPACTKNLLAAYYILTGNLDGITRCKHTITVDQAHMVIFVEVMLAWATTGISKLQEISELPLISDLVETKVAVGGRDMAAAAYAHYAAALNGQDVTKEFIVDLGHEFLDEMEGRIVKLDELEVAWDAADETDAVT